MPITLKPKNFIKRDTTAEDAEKLIALEQRIMHKDLELERLALENQELREKIKQSSDAAAHQRQIEQGKFEIERERFGFLRRILDRLVWTFIAALVFTAASLTLAALGIFDLETSQKDILARAILVEVAGLVVAAIGAFVGGREKPKDRPAA